MVLGPELGNLVSALDLKPKLELREESWCLALQLKEDTLSYYRRLTLSSLVTEVIAERGKLGPKLDN